MLKDHDETNVQTDLAPVPSIDNLNEITFNDNSKGALEGISGGVQNESSEARSLQVNEPKLNFIDIQLENEQEDYLNIPLNGKWMPSTNPVHIGTNFKTLKNMRYAPEHPVSIMGMSRFNSASHNNYTFNLFHYTKAAVKNSAGTEIRAAESHLIEQGFNSQDAPTTFILKQLIGAIPAQTAETAAQIYPAVGNKSGNKAGIFSTCPNDGMVFCWGKEDCIWDGDESRVPAFIGIKTALSAITDVPTDPQDFGNFINNANKATTNDYSAATIFLIGSTRPLSGVTLYATSSWSGTTTVTYFNGTTWASITDTEGGDGTEKRTITWTAASYTPVKKYIEGYFLYWYQFVLSVSKDLYHATVTAPFCPINDTWDGQFLEIAAAYNFEGYSTEGEIYDITLNVLNADDYLASDKTSFWDLAVHGDFDTSDCFYIGFTEEVCGIYFDFPDPLFVNDSTAANMIVEYWNGTTWTAISNKIDGTVNSGKPFAKTGLVSFVPPGAKKLSKVSSLPLVYYRVRFDADDIKGDTRIGYIAGIPISKTIQGHSFAIHAADRLMLGCDNYENKNELLVSAQDRPEVFNGKDSLRIQFGDNQALTCGAPIFAQYASNIYNIILIFKATQTWILQWNQSNTGTSWSRFCISPNVGCPAPNTLCSASVAFDNNVSQVKNVAIWRGNNGIYISNGQSPYCVSDDISHVFDQNNLLDSSLIVNQSMIYRESAFVDEDKGEYHWLWASGSNTHLDKEYVLDLKEWKWFEIVRGTGKELACGLTARDVNGNKYAFGCIPEYVERLEHGCTFDSTTAPYTDGSSISSEMTFGELIPSKNPAITTSIKKLYLTCMPKATDTSVGVTHYRDGDSTGTSYTIQMDETLDIDVSPATDWAAGDIITGQTSGKTCIVVSKISSTTYKVKERNGAFTLGEIIGVTGDSNKLADQGAAHPVFLASQNSFVFMKKDIGSQDASFHGLKFTHTSTASTKGFEPLTITAVIKRGREK